MLMNPRVGPRPSYPALTMLRLSCLIFSFWLALFVPPAQAQARVSEPITLALQSQQSAPLRSFIRETLDQVALILQDKAILSDTLSPMTFADSKTLSRYQFVIVSAPVFAALERYAGYTAIASIQPIEAISPNTASSTTLLVKRKSTEGIVTLNKLAGKTLALSESDQLDVLMHLKEELKLQGQNPEKFFKIVKVNSGLPELTSLLLDGNVDVVALPSILMREFTGNMTEQLQVLEPRLSLELDQPHTTGVFPGWVLAASIHISRDEVENFSALLKSLPPTHGFSWHKPADYRNVHQILRSNNDVFYQSFKKRTWLDLLQEYAAWLGLIVVVLLGMLFHIVRADRLVKKRTTELMAMHEEKNAAQKRYEHLERASIVGQMSNLVAHELRQPLAAISNYAMGIRRRIQNGTLDDEALLFALNRVIAENDRANDIVQHVQGYAVKSARQSERVDITALLKLICASYTDSQGKSRVESIVAKDLYLQADALEIELIIRNLIKNAFEAGRAAGNPIISLQANTDVQGTIRIRVADRGLALSKEAFAKLTVPLNSNKPDGLGLGLAIVRKIVETYGGHLEFDRVIPQGLAVTIVVPTEETQQEAS